ncbi:hypothetical protein [Siminovitchia fordii]|uniref:Uncharacterized protein n=1 Tax=Siminovitchia fordii TaxID=254759 RepID=A0ABQ4K4Y6_9BACI|nr:hypothetical protein [Siminovitchia fordii]GIN20794.1 hypothetical protein J1TS3_19280 [Siminovitchia fordii]
MDISILIGLVIFLAVVALFLVFFIGSALNFDDASRVDRPASPEDFEGKRGY